MKTYTLQEIGEEIREMLEDLNHKCYAHLKEKGLDDCVLKIHNQADALIRVLHRLSDPSGQDYRYIVIDEPKNGSGDIFETSFLSLDNANADAHDAWGYLTASEKRKRHIYVGKRTLDCLNAFDFPIIPDKGEIDWESGGNLESTDGCFDSENPNTY